MVRCDEERILVGRSTSLFVRSYQAVPQNDRKTLLLIHGFGEHGGRYEHVCAALCERGWNIVLPDLRGHGMSGGSPAHIDRFDRFAEDLAIVRERYHSEPDRTIVLGHSMGGLVAIRYAQIRPDDIAGIALSSPLLRINVSIPWHTLAIGHVAAVVAPRVRFKSRVDPSETTSSPEALQHRLDDPLIRRFMTAGCYFSIREGLRKAWRHAESVGVPVLILQAGADSIVDPDASCEWLQETASGDCRCQILDDHLHEILNEPDWDETLNTFTDWMEQRIAA